jgi:hypothetical protein
MKSQHPEQNKQKKPLRVKWKPLFLEAVDRFTCTGWRLQRELLTPKETET